MPSIYKPIILTTQIVVYLNSEIRSFVLHPVKGTQKHDQKSTIRINKSVQGTDSEEVLRHIYWDNIKVYTCSEVHGQL